MRILGPINLVFLILPDMTYCISGETYYQGRKTYHLGAEPGGIEPLLPGRPGPLAIWGATPSFYSPTARPDQLLGSGKSTISKPRAYKCSGPLPHLDPLWVKSFLTCQGTPASGNWNPFLEQRPSLFCGVLCTEDVLQKGSSHTHPPPS